MAETHTSHPDPDAMPAGVGETPRMYLPTNYVDEVIPPPRSTPSDWIVTLPGDVYALAPCDEMDEDSDPRIIKPGDIVKFDWTESYGLITVNIAADGSFTTDVPPDPRANNVWVRCDPDTIDESVASFVENWWEPTPAIVELEQYAWSLLPDRYCFEIVDGTPRFVLVGAHHG